MAYMTNSEMQIMLDACNSLEFHGDYETRDKLHALVEKIAKDKFIYKERAKATITAKRKLDKNYARSKGEKNAV